MMAYVSCIACRQFLKLEVIHVNLEQYHLSTLDSTRTKGINLQLLKICIGTEFDIEFEEVTSMLCLESNHF